MSEPALKLQTESVESTLKDAKSTRKIVILITVVTMAIAISVSFYWFFYLKHFVTTDDAYIEADFYPVSTKIPGAIKEVLVHEGDAVTQGQVLLIIDDSDLAFEKNYKKLKVEKAQLDFKRSQTLHNSKAISDFDFENAEANLKSAEIDLQGTEIKISYTKVMAPASGVVAKRSSQIGQVIQPGQSLFVLVNDKEPWIKANFKETQIENLKIGQAVSIYIDGYSHMHFHGSVESIFPSSGAKLSILPPENSTGNFTRVVQRIPIKISFNKQDLKLIELKPGMSAEVSIDTSSEITHAKR